jgi:radical SAM protein with 4Fe4S-binding SPASM domain
VVTPVRDFPHLEWSLNAETVEAFKSGYTEYAEWLLECLAGGDDRVYVALVEHDFFGRFLIRVIRGTKQPYRCEAGRTTFGVSVDGGLYPCDNFVKLEEFRLGDVFTGLDSQKHAAFLQDTLIDQKPVCKDCWARYQCGGGCYFTAALANGDHRIPHAAKCDLIRHCVELSIWIVAELGRRNPPALERLARNVLGAQSLQVTPGINE